jgi:hypothetical protein
MYLIRRVAMTQPGKAWEVAGLLTKVCRAYEEAGRNKAQIFIGGSGLPGTPDVVYAEWIQETIEPTDPRKVPEGVRTYGSQMQPLLVGFPIEFFELVTPEKLQARGLD